MASLLQAVVALGWPVLVAGPLGRGRRGLWALLALLIASYVGGLAVGALQPLDPLWLPQWTGLQSSALLLILWAAYGATAAAAGGAKMPGTPLFGAVLTGAVLGELAAAAVLTAGSTDRRSAARLALAASAGGLLGRVGDPAMLLLAAREPEMMFMLAPLAILCVLVLFPGGPLQATEGRWSVSIAGLLTAVGATVLGSHAWIALLLGMVVLAVLAGPERLRGLDWRLPARAAVLCGIIVLATAGGLPELIAEGLEHLQRLAGGSMKPAMALASALIAVLCDSTGAALLAESVLDRGLSLSTPGVAASMAAGIAVGGIGPLVIAGAVREGAGRLLLQIGLAVAWAGLVL